MLKTTAFQRNVCYIVVDEAHLVDDWYMLLISLNNLLICSELQCSHHTAV